MTEQDQKLLESTVSMLRKWSQNYGDVSSKKDTDFLRGYYEGCHTMSEIVADHIERTIELMIKIK